MKIISVKTSELIPYENNAKKHDETQIKNVAESIRQFGWQQPIVIDRKNVIVIGHCRHLAAQRLGLEQVPCTVAEDLTDEQIRALRIADNKTNESPWEVEMLQIELADLDISAFDFDFDFDFDPETTEATEDEDFDPTPPQQTKVKLGDLYKLGDHMLLCGDATKTEHVKRLCTETVDLYLTDPPYGVDYEGKGKERLKIQSDDKSSGELEEFLVNAFRAADSVMRPGAVFYIWHAIVKGTEFGIALREVGWEIRQILIWNKNSMVLGRQDYQWKHEPCMYGWKEGAAHTWCSDRKQTTILEFDRPTKNKEHPTMKPVALFDYLIKNSTTPGQIVYDSFGGSGTTIIACEQNKRRARVMELDPKYADVIIRRWEEFTGKKAELVKK